ncbi:MAG: hypothetical protein U9R44_03420 [Candidatus Omnitrophota bacterium]|nr:hypothetical protein [Candidatus Omnitrophota bacterium]
MKKLIALIAVIVFLISASAGFAEEASTTTSKGTTGRGGFWNEFADLFRIQIPETMEQKSQTHTIWEQTEGRGKEQIK